MNDDSTSITRTVAFLRAAGRAKHELRTGWVEHKVEPHPPESIGSHMWRMSLICMMMPKEITTLSTAPNSSSASASAVASSSKTTTEKEGEKKKEEFPLLDRDHCIRMALSHDVSEVIVGDVSPRMNVPKEVKAKAEKDAIEKDLAPLLPNANSEELVQLFREFEENKTSEANFVHDVDILDMIITALDYQSTTKENLSSFFTSTGKIKHPWVRACAEHVQDLWKATLASSSSSEQPTLPKGAVLVPPAKKLESCAESSES